ncbi:serine/threonine protein kinase VPS15, putative [Plasmodium vivax]|uniref:Serine/threonine protein kinase VPS15, putative n=1 Tax=Plasmodium vivax TaxID=5855 RepID=A0A1G4H8S5_PLAVI|nr:serine/threonine protein kinase VPS15, putative [Plasmodium vivax]
MGNTLYSSTGCSSTQLDDIYGKYLNNLYNIYSYLFKYEHFVFMNCYALNSFCHVLEGINNNEGHVLIKVFKMRCETQKIKRILYTLKFLFSFDLFPNVLPYNRMSVYENNIYIYRTFVFKSLDHYLFNERNNKPFSHFILFQIFLAIIQLHSLGIYHGHIKSENFLLQNNMHILLTDISILNKYLYFIPGVRCEDQRSGLLQRRQRLQDDIFNLGILVLEILLSDKSVSYAFVKEDYQDKDVCNFHRGRSRQGMIHFVGNKKGADKSLGKGKSNGKVKRRKKKEDKDSRFTSSGSVESGDRLIDLSVKKTSHNFVHALSLPFINKRIKNEEENYFQENKHVKLNIHKYRHYNYHYINSVNYINIYNDFYNSGTLHPVSESNSRRESLTCGGNLKSETLYKSRTVLYGGRGEDGSNSLGEEPHAYSDYEVVGGEPKGGRRKGATYGRLDLRAPRDWGSASSSEAGDPPVERPPGGAAEVVTKEVGAAEVVTKEVGAAEVVTKEVGAAEVVTKEVGAAEVVTKEVGSAEVVTKEVGSAEVVTTEAVAAEVRAAEVPSAECAGAAPPRRRGRQAERREKGVPYKIWKIANVAKHPFIVYSLINHFFLQKNKNIFKIFKYWSYHIFPSTYKYVFFPLTILQLHPVFKNADMFILLLHFNLPFILFHLDLFAQKERDKYEMLKMGGSQHGEDAKGACRMHQRSCHARPSLRSAQEGKEAQGRTRKSRKARQTGWYAGRLAHFVDVVGEFTTGVNHRQMETYIRGSDLGDHVKTQLLQQWRAHRREAKGGSGRTGGAYHSTCHFPFPTLSYQNAHEFYRNFLAFYKTLFNAIFHEDQSYIDVFGGLETCKRGIYAPLFRAAPIRRSNSNGRSSPSSRSSRSSRSGCRPPKWRFNEDALQLANMIIVSYHSLAYEATKLLCLEMLYCIIYHLNDSALNREVASFLLFCLNKSGEKLKVIIIKSFYRIMHNENAYEHMYPYVQKFLPSFFSLKDSKEKMEKYFFVKYLPLVANVTIQYIYNVSLLKRGSTKQKQNFKGEQDEQKTGPDEITISEVKHMDMLKTLRNQLVNILKYATDETLLFEFYEHLITFCKIMSKKWVKIYILPYLLANIYRTKNGFIRAVSIRITLRIMSYINDSETYRMICGYVNPILFEGNELAILFLLSECNILLQKNARRGARSSAVPPSGRQSGRGERGERSERNKMRLLFAHKLKLNHLRNHPSVAIRNLVHAVQANLLQMPT